MNDLDALIQFASAPKQQVARPSAEQPAPTPELPRPKPPVSFTNITGRVEVRRHGSKTWDDADLDTVLGDLDMVRTGKGDTADLRFMDGTVISIKPHSMFRIDVENADEETRFPKPGNTMMEAAGPEAVSTMGAMSPGSMAGGGAEQSPLVTALLQQLMGGGSPEGGV